MSKVTAVRWLVVGLALGVVAISFGVWSWFSGDVLSNRAAVEAALGVSLPDAISNVQYLEEGGFDGGVMWFAADVTEDDFHGLMQVLGMTPRDDLLEDWPTAFCGPGEAWWNSQPARAGVTYFHPDLGGSYSASARFIDGTMYFHRSGY